MNRTTPARALALFTAAALAITACGDTEDTTDTGTGTETETTSPTEDGTAAGDVDLAAFCSAVIEGEQIFTAGPELDEEGNPTQDGLQQFSDQLNPVLEDIRANTPEDIASEVDVVLSAVDQALQSGDPAGTESPEFFQADAAIDDYVFDNCELETTQEITGVEYAYEGVPPTISAGQVGIRLNNEGEEVHEAVVFRINDDVEQSIDELLQLPEEEAEQMVEFKGVAFAAPGESGVTVTDFEPGRYGFVCFIPVGTTSLEALFADEGEGGTESPTETASPTEAGTEGEGGGEEGPPHFTQGMFVEFEVE